MIASRVRGMRCLAGPWSLAALLGTTILLAAGAPSAIAGGRPLVTGVSGLDTYDPAALQQVRATGAQLVHISIEWNRVGPHAQPSAWNPEDPADPNYDWEASDTAVTRVVEAGLTPVVAIYGAPKWAQRCQAPEVVRGEVLKGAVCDPDPAELAAFAKAAAIRYGGGFRGLPRVRYWQALNEPNLSLAFDPQWRNGKGVSAALYRKLINAFYFAVKSVNPSNLVLAAGLGPIAVPHLTIGPMRFTRELLCMTGRHNPRPTRGNCHGGVHFDIFDIHPYTTGGPTHKGNADDVELGDISRLGELIGAADRAGRIKGRLRRTEIWVTEFSWDSKPPDPAGLAMPILKRWTAEALYRAWNAGISRFFWFSLRDFPPEQPVFGVSLQSGLYFRGATVAEDRPKPSMYAFRFPFVAYSRPSGFFFWGRTPTSKGGRVRVQIRQGGGWRNAGVTNADKNGIFVGMVKGVYGRHEHGWVRAHYRGESAVAFSLHPIKDFYHAPFGSPVK